MPVHVPVLLNEVIDLMNVRPGGSYIDATFGRGGHSRALLERLGPNGRLFVFDRDPDAIAQARQLADADPRVHAVHGRFSTIEDVARRHDITADGILFDLGVSTPQITDPSRGFSFQNDGPLDMRMDPDGGESAAQWLSHAPESEISDVLWRYGEERRSRQIARRIVETRRDHPLTTTSELATLVRSCMRGPRGRIDPATRTFQAVRIFVNDELGEVERALAGALRILGVGGRMLVIAFHSLEDRLVKNLFRDIDRAARELPDGSSAPAFRLVMRKPIMTGEVERAQNPRARSARLRVLERVA